uniref:Uncharacterized protein n=1 Tax=Junco hyemalis TaxID=40217 RepID=A0A8C5IT95_JUNHY
SWPAVSLRVQGLFQAAALTKCLETVTGAFVCCCVHPCLRPRYHRWFFSHFSLSCLLQPLMVLQRRLYR